MQEWKQLYCQTERFTLDLIASFSRVLSVTGVRTTYDTERYSSNGIASRFPPFSTNVTVVLVVGPSSIPHSTLEYSLTILEVCQFRQPVVSEHVSLSSSIASKLSPRTISSWLAGSTDFDSCRQTSRLRHRTLTCCYFATSSGHYLEASVCAECYAPAA